MPKGDPHARANILGVGIHAVDMVRAVGLIDSAIAEHRKGVVCLTGVHGVMEARKDSDFRSVLNRAFLNLPDGRPTVWIGRLEGFTRMDHGPGPQLMLSVCEMSLAKGYTHFLYGGKAGVAEDLRKELLAKFPSIKIVGTYTPPFRPLNTDDERNLRRMFSDLEPDITWIGLSTPKQEKFMAKYIEQLRTKVMVGVGAAFDMHTGRIKDSPEWMKRAGLAWLYRLLQEPRRLWRRYLGANPRFLCEITLQLLRLKKYDLEDLGPESLLESELTVLDHGSIDA